MEYGQKRKLAMNVLPRPVGRMIARDETANQLPLALAEKWVLSALLNVFAAAAAFRATCDAQQMAALRRQGR